MKFSLFGSLLFFLALLSTQNAEAGFSNNGRMQSTNLNLNVGGTLDNNGELIGTESAKISCDTLSGKGVITSPEISIKTGIFAYTGKIECSGKCIIIAKSPFNEKMFKRSGKGEFIIIIDKKAIEQTSRSFMGEYTITDELLMEVE